jgi:hypothetical protein
VLILVGIGCALSSTTAFFLHVAGWVPMPFFLTVAGLPLVVLLLIVGLYARRRRLPFWLRFRAGLLAGVVGLLAYDLVRLALFRSGLVEAYPFHALPLFGAIVTGLEPTTGAALAAGWAYHLWNGMNFAILYALIAGPARWWWGVAWAGLLELAMLWAYPSFLAIRANADFVAMSAVGHGAYGVAIGLTVERWARERVR